LTTEERNFEGDWKSSLSQSKFAQDFKNENKLYVGKQRGARLDRTRDLNINHRTAGLKAALISQIRGGNKTKTRENV